MLALQLQLLRLSSARMACGSHADRIWHHVLLYCCSSCCCSVVDYEEVRAAAAAAADEKIEQVRNYVAKFGQASELLRQLWKCALLICVLDDAAR